MPKKPYCCFISDQDKLDQGCQNPAAYEIYMLDNPTPDSNTVSCAEHLEIMLDDSHRFEIVRIPQEEGWPNLEPDLPKPTCESCGGEDWHHTIECYLGKTTYQIPTPAKFHCANCDEFRGVVLNQNDIVCAECSWIIATYTGTVSLLRIQVDDGQR